MAHFGNLAQRTYGSVARVTNGLTVANSTVTIYTTPANTFLYPYAIACRLLSTAGLPGTTSLAFGVTASAYNDIGTMTSVDATFGSSALTSPSPFIVRINTADTMVTASTAIVVKYTGATTLVTTVFEFTIICSLFTV